MANIDKVTLNGTNYTIVDSTVPSWAKQSTKPTYNGSEVNYTGTTGNVVTNNTTLNTAIQALDTAMGDVLTALNAINGDNAVLEWNVTLVYGEDYSTWEKMNITQDIFDALSAETLPLDNIKFTYNGVTESPLFYGVGENEWVYFNNQSNLNFMHDMIGGALYIKPDGTTNFTSSYWD